MGGYVGGSGMYVIKRGEGHGRMFVWGSGIGRCVHPEASLTFSNVNCYHKTQGYQHSLPLPWFHL